MNKRKLICYLFLASILVMSISSLNTSERVITKTKKFQDDEITNEIHIKTSNYPVVWSYAANNKIDTTVISDDGKYIVAGTYTSTGLPYQQQVHLFHSSNSTPVWTANLMETCIPWIFLQMAVVLLLGRVAECIILKIQVLLQNGV